MLKAHQTLPCTWLSLLTPYSSPENPLEAPRIGPQKVSEPLEGGCRAVKASQPQPGCLGQSQLCSSGLVCLARLPELSALQGARMYAEVTAASASLTSITGMGSARHAWVMCSLSKREQNRLVHSLFPSTGGTIFLKNNFKTMCVLRTGISHIFF